MNTPTSLPEQSALPGRAALTTLTAQASFWRSARAFERDTSCHVYLVGGAVRDALLGQAIKDSDWVVVGATSSLMTEQGFKQVGADFPVFLHPETGEEFALARQERKTGPGYTGFTVEAGAHVSLPEDLLRRDLTINALALDSKGVLHDHFGGLRDLENKCLRHVSPAFAEDPVRILRVARFMARYGKEGFTVAPETLALMSDMVQRNALLEVTPERLWKEISRALLEPMPSAFLRTLRDCGALRVLLPEVDVLYGIPQHAQWHPEVDTGIHVEMVIDQASRCFPGRLDVAFACLTHDLGKGLTPQEILPGHHGHETAGLPLVENVCARLKVPRDITETAKAVCVYHLHAHRCFESRPGTLLDVLEAVDAFRRPQRFEAFLCACEADKRGRTGFEDEPYPQADYLRQVATAARAARVQPDKIEGATGEDIREHHRRQRLSAIQEVRGSERHRRRSP